jgi:hypothetical protein
MRLILPFAVILKRFLAPRWVFSFNFGFVEFLGMTEMLSLLGGIFAAVTVSNICGPACREIGRGKPRPYLVKLGYCDC